MTTTWASSTNNDWSTTANWSSGTVPTSNNIVIINNDVTITGVASANSITLDGAAVLAMAGGTLTCPIINGGADGYGTVYTTGQSPLNTSQMFYAHNGTLKVLGITANSSANFDAGSNSTIEISGIIGSNETVYLSTINATLVLDTPTTFSGAIDMGVNDKIDLVGITASSATYSGTTLTINETNGQQLIYSNVLTSSGYIPTVSNDGHGGTLIAAVMGVNLGSAATAQTLDGSSGLLNFEFAQNTTGKPSATNFYSILNFSGHDEISFTTPLLVVGNSGAATDGLASINATTGIATFSAHDSTLALQLAAVENAIAAANTPAAGHVAMWANGSNTEILITDSHSGSGIGAGDNLIQLTDFSLAHASLMNGMVLAI
jgi:hypothetical protein